MREEVKKILHGKKPVFDVSYPDGDCNDAMLRWEIRTNEAGQYSLFVSEHEDEDYPNRWDVEITADYLREIADAIDELNGLRGGE